jgi:class 3 adenylate cyclase
MRREPPEVCRPWGSGGPGVESAGFSASFWTGGPISSSSSKTPAAELPSGTVTFLFSDIEGSAKLLRELGDERYGELLAAHNALLGKAFADSGGVEINRHGDSFFTAFAEAPDAVEATAVAQRALAAAE